MGQFEALREEVKLPLRTYYKRLYNGPSPHSLSSLLSVGTQGDVTYVSQTGSRGFNTTSFGHSVATSGAYAIIGNPNTYQGTGLVYIYKFVVSAWSYTQTLYMPSTYEYQNSGSLAPVTVNHDAYYYVKHKSDQANSGYNSYFGNGVSLNGKWAIIGAPGWNYKAGAAFVYKLNNITSTWEYFQMLSCQSPLASVVGAVTIIQKTKSYFVQTMSTQGFQNINYAYFGFSVGVGSGFAAVGSSCNSNCGYASSTPYQTIIPVATAAVPNIANMTFGYSVSINVNMMLVGAPTANYGKGATYIYELWGTTWTQTNVLSDTVQGEYGYAVNAAPSGGSAMIAAP
eukprot:gene26810-33451_t